MYAYLAAQQGARAVVSYILQSASKLLACGCRLLSQSLMISEIQTGLPCSPCTFVSEILSTITWQGSAMQHPKSERTQRNYCCSHTHMVIIFWQTYLKELLLTGPLSSLGCIDCRATFRQPKGYLG